MNIHLGAYVKCRVSKLEADDFRWGCTNKVCLRYHVRAHEGDPYCPRCGSDNEKWRAGTQVNRDYVAKAIAVTGERLSFILHYDNAQHDVWIANYPAPETCVEQDFRDECEEAIEIDDPHALRIKHLNNLEQGFAQDIAILRQYYGSENVTLEWGLVGW